MKTIYYILFGLFINTTLLASEPSMQEFLQEYYSSSERNVENYSKLLYSTKKNYSDISIKLLKSGENPNFVNTKKSFTPFMYAIINNDVSLVEFMIEKGADVNLASGDFPDTTPLLVSITMHADNEITKLLCDAGARAIKQLPLWNWSYQNSLSYAMMQLDVDKFFMIAETLSIGEIQALDQIKNNLFQTSMNWYLIENGGEKSIQIAEYLTNRGVSIETENSSALSLSISNGNIKLMQYLITKGANLNYGPTGKNNYAYGQSPLIAALFFQKNHENISKNSQNNLQNIPQKDEPLLILLANNVELNYSIPIPTSLPNKESRTEKYGYSPLGFAITEHLNEAVETLISYGADVHIVEASGKTPLIRAVESKNFDGLILLLSAGADPLKKGKFDQRTPIEIAYSLGYTEMFNALIEYEANSYK